MTVAQESNDLLVLASDPDVRLETLLAEVLERALGLSGSESGALLLLDPEGQGKHRIVERGAASDRARPLLLNWVKQPPPHPCAAVLGPEDFAFAGRSPKTPGGCALLVPLLEKRHLVGVLLLGSSRPDHYGLSGQARLAAFAGDATAAIQRLLARHQLQRSGFALDMVGISPSFLELESQVRRAAAAGGNVLILGERGTGKELIAHALHAWSSRRDGQFVTVLAAALAENLLAAELYGHEAHSFTGAERARAGRFSAAHGGTLFLDEVGDMPLGVQSALLRVVERGEVQRVGRDEPVRVDVRIVAATNRNLEEAIDRGEFRADLFDRLSILRIVVPPLRERREDIPLLANHFLRRGCEQGKRFLLCSHCRGTMCGWNRLPGCLSDDFVQALQAYDWPGNVRELSNLMSRLLVTVDDEVLTADDLPASVRRSAGAPAASREPADLSLETATRRHIERVLTLTGNRQSQAARLLGIPYSTLQSKMRKLGISVHGPVLPGGEDHDIA